MPELNRANASLVNGTVTFLFTDIEGSAGLWEEEPERMRAALACHDRLVRDAVAHNAGKVVKATGDGIHAVFSDPADGVAAAIAMQRALADPTATAGLALRIRTGLHVGYVELRDADYFGSAVNRAARIMGAAYGGQILLSQSIVEAIDRRLPTGIALRELGTVLLRGMTQPERVRQIVHPELRSEFPALRSLETTPSNLPTQLTSFVGREHERAEVAALVRRFRLVTLVGVGGLGKTRLSLCVAADLLDSYADGVWFVELASLSDPRLVPHAVATVLGIREEPGHPVIKALVKFAAERNFLLILDNCEHLAQACANIAESLLQSGPRVSILASSREHLRIGPERVYPVSTLSLPPSDREVSLDELRQYGAVQLFAERALAVQPDFRLSEESASATIDICRRLDGIPLAIELAAARLQSMSLESIAARLTHRLRLLTGGSRTALGRQQTLTALIDWSHDLLSVKERVLFRRLAAFAGGWTLEAAEAVGAGDQVEAADVIDLLTALVEKSMVGFGRESSRYFLLETFREYGLQRLHESGERASVQARHISYFLDLGEQSYKPIQQGDRSARDWLKVLDAERENLLAAHTYCDAADCERGVGLELAHACYPYWRWRGSVETGSQILREALARHGAQAQTKARCRALHAAGLLSCYAGRFEEAQSYLTECEAATIEIGFDLNPAGRIQLLAFALLGQGKWSLARRRCEQALSLARQSGDRLQEASALSNLAQTYRVAGQLDEATSLLRLSNNLALALPNLELIAMNTVTLAMIALSKRDVPAAVVTALEALEVAGEGKSKHLGQAVLDLAVGLASCCEEWEVASRLLGAAESHLISTGFRRDPVDDAFLEPLVARAKAALGAASFDDRVRQGGRGVFEDAMTEVMDLFERHLQQ